MLINPIEIDTTVRFQPTPLSHKGKRTMVITKLIIPLLLLQLSTTAFSQNAGPKYYCVAKVGTSDQVLSANIDYACNQASVNCQDVRPGGACFNSDLKTRASFAMNAFYNLYRSLGGTCDFSGSGQIINTDPSTFTCKFVASDGDSGSKPPPIVPHPPGNVYNPKPIPKTPKRSVLGGDGPVRKWCVAKPHADTDTLDKHLDWLCGMVECQAIKPGGACYDESIRAQASFAMNSYYQTRGRNDNYCDFSGTAVITTVDPSHGPCRYLS